ncbi:hypothetical protein [Streptococcus uberis]|uniref:hypothetical protein n=1 Tax=Streptococcus uberis TaxID=1349 RepID=UPI00062033D2|nr:hypothetical protein [Streptococcus uberis]KKF56989.1 hypothetical protein AF69_06030 [Streptococcus uberis 6736]QBX21937.1 hypothetical protein Javan617_0042 [Streptococcus phage Javan617]
MTENPITAVVVLITIAIVAYLGNRNSNQKTIEQTMQKVIDNNRVIQKPKFQQNVRRDFIECPTPGSCGKIWGVDKPF